MPEVPALDQALVSFSVDGLFPEENISSLALSSDKLPEAIQALSDAKSKLEAEIHTINEETADDVNTWITRAKALQDDKNRSRTWANEIIKQAEAPIVSGEALRHAEERAEFLVKELNYNQHLRQALMGIKAVSQLLDQVEQASDERRIIDALRLLEKSWTDLDAIPISKSCRAMRLLDIRAFELKSAVHDVFDHVWKALTHVDVDNGSLSILQTSETEPMSLSDAVIGLKAYKEVDDKMKSLWHDLDKAIVAPRTDIASKSLPSISAENGVLRRIAGEADRSVQSLFNDLQLIFSFLAENFPADLVQAISSVMMPELMSRVINVWLDSAVPASLTNMDLFEALISDARVFCSSLAQLGYSGFSDLQDWVDSAPRIWLSKCRETALDTVRTKLSQGLGASKAVERVEKQMVSKSEAKQLTSNGPSSAAADQPDWDAAWSDGGGDEAKKDVTIPSIENSEEPGEPEDDGADAWGAWGEEEEALPETTQEEQKTDGNPDAEEDDDDAADAWGWGEDDNKENDGPKETPAMQPREAEQSTREMTLKETYHISSMPEPVLALVFAILEDGAALTTAENETSPVAKAAAGLFSLPTLALAMFRAVSPYYYALSNGGNMFLYNDASYLAERLADFTVTWKTRDDLSPRAKAMLRLDNEIKTLQNFANRAYGNEMRIQKTVLDDLLGGPQNIFQQDDSESYIDAAISRVTAVGMTWECILTKSAWHQAVGSLIDAVAEKIISNVTELDSISPDTAYNIASLIAKVSALDGLFKPNKGPGRAASEDVSASMTQYVGSWLRLQFLSRILQSDLSDVRSLWFGSQLSLYFRADEVVDLIKNGFEDNLRSRELIREITQHPHPV